MPQNDLLIEEVEDNIYIIYGKKPSCHVYVLKGTNKNVLIDTGIKGNFPRVVEGLTKVGLKVSDIHLVINTHEHFDHVGGNIFFHETAFLAAHRFAVTKIELQDEYVMHSAIHGEEILKVKSHIWMEDRLLFDIGSCKLKIFHTPGHTSGCICIYEPFKHFMFTGDTIFDKGVVSKISDSGSWGDYINSLERINTLKMKKLFPGHGTICEKPEEAITIGIRSSRAKFEGLKSQMLEELKNKRIEGND